MCAHRGIRNQETGALFLAGTNGTESQSASHGFSRSTKRPLTPKRRFSSVRRHCQVNCWPRDQATISSIQARSRYPYLGVVSACDALARQWSRPRIITRPDPSRPRLSQKNKKSGKPGTGSFPASSLRGNFSISRLGELLTLRRQSDASYPAPDSWALDRMAVACSNIYFGPKTKEVEQWMIL